jgi:hypothetical protein
VYVIFVRFVIFVRLKIFTKYVCFKEELSLGTILYGTLVDNNFVCETIHLYKNESIGGNYVNKLNIMKEILKFSIKDSDLESISFKLPQMSNSKILLECSNLPYQIYGILQIDNRPKMIILHHLFGHFNIKKDSFEWFAKEYFLINLRIPYHF